jgi:hypothetical protein
MKKSENPAKLSKGCKKELKNVSSSGGKKSIPTPRRVAPYTPTRSCVHIGVLKNKIKSQKNKINKE